MKLRVFVGAALALLAFLFVLGLLHCSPLTPADHRAIAHDAVRIAVCQSYGRQCKADTDAGNCFDVYDACMVDAGLR